LIYGIIDIDEMGSASRSNSSTVIWPLGKGVGFLSFFALSPGTEGPRRGVSSSIFEFVDIAALGTKDVESEHDCPRPPL
jgi:hypothetical protein